MSASVIREGTFTEDAAGNLFETVHVRIDGLGINLWTDASESDEALIERAQAIFDLVPVYPENRRMRALGYVYDRFENSPVVANALHTIASLILNERDYDEWCS